MRLPVACIFVIAVLTACGAEGPPVPLRMDAGSTAVDHSGAEARHY